LGIKDILSNQAGLPIFDFFVAGSFHGMCKVEKVKEEGRESKMGPKRFEIRSGLWPHPGICTSAIFQSPLLATKVHFFRQFFFFASSLLLHPIFFLPTTSAAHCERLALYTTTLNNDSSGNSPFQHLVHLCLAVTKIYLLHHCTFFPSRSNGMATDVGSSTRTKWTWT
jgi:hypothetical protein